MWREGEIMAGSGVASRRGKSKLETLICICIMLSQTTPREEDKNIFRYIEL